MMVEGAIADGGASVGGERARAEGSESVLGRLIVVIVSHAGFSGQLVGRGAVDVGFVDIDEVACRGERERERGRQATRRRRTRVVGQR